MQEIKAIKYKMNYIWYGCSDNYFIGFLLVWLQVRDNDYRMVNILCFALFNLSKSRPVWSGLFKIMGQK